MKVWADFTAISFNRAMEWRVNQQDAQITRRREGLGIEAVANAGATTMPTTLKNATKKYVKARDLSLGTRREYQTTIAKWQRWKGRVSIERLDRPTIREFLSWVHDQAVADGGTNPGRTSNKARTHLRAVISWAWENDLIAVSYTHLTLPTILLV